MAKAIDLLVDNEFQAERDTDENKTTWLLTSLTGMQLLNCTKKGYVDHDAIINIGLTGWKDFPDSKGKDIPFSLDNIRRIPAVILQDISFELQTMASLVEDERKN